MVTVKKKSLGAEITDLISRWTERLNLQEWRIAWEWGRSDFGGHKPDAQMVSHFGQRRTTIFLCEDIKGDRGRLRSAVVHELVHCRVAEMSDSIINQGLEELLGHTAWTVFYESWRRHLEMEVEALTVIFLKVWKDSDLRLV